MSFRACNPPDDIFLVALPFKLFGVKYIFDHHDVNPELYLSKYGKKDMLYKIQVWLEKMTFRCSDVVMSTNCSYRRARYDARRHVRRRCLCCAQRAQSGNV